MTLDSRDLPTRQSSLGDDRYVISPERLKEIEDLIVFDGKDNLALAKGVTGDQAAAAIYDLWSERQEARGE